MVTEILIAIMIDIKDIYGCSMFAEMHHWNKFKCEQLRVFV